MSYPWNSEVCSIFSRRKFEKLFSNELIFEIRSNFIIIYRANDRYKYLTLDEKESLEKTFDKSKVQALSVGLMGNYTMSFADYGNLVSVTHLRSRGFLALQRVKLLPFISSHPFLNQLAIHPVLSSLNACHDFALSVFERYWCDA